MFKSKIPYTLHSCSSNKTVFSFHHEGLEYNVGIEPDSVDESFWSIYLISGVPGSVKNDELTGFGEPYKILSTTISILKEHMNIHGVRPIRILAVDEQRCKLYHLITRKTFPDWHIFVAGHNVIMLPLTYFQNRALNEENYCLSA